MKPIRYSHDWRRLYYPQLYRDQKDCVYLDHAGTTLYSRALLDTVSKYFQDENELLGNPHSETSLPAQTSQKWLTKARELVLKHFDADPAEYAVIWTMNATHAIEKAGRLVSWKFDSKSSLQETCWLLIKLLVRGKFTLCWQTVLGFMRPSLRHLWMFENSHTSCAGLCQLAKTKGALVEIMDERGVESRLQRNMSDVPLLFVYPAQCHLTGERYPLRWINEIKSVNPENMTLLDCASFATSCQLSLRQFPADFVTLSFYKMFGLPTSLGALIVKKSVIDLEALDYFGGGSVAAQTIRPPWHQFHMEDVGQSLQFGTPPFLECMILVKAFEIHETIYESWNSITRHTRELIGYAYHQLRELKHQSGRPLIEFNIDHDKHNPGEETHGSLLSFILFDHMGRVIPTSYVTKLADLSGIYLRAGTMCNPGSWQRFLRKQLSDVQNHFLEHGKVCGFMDESHDSNTESRGWGLLRISVGAMSLRSDIDFFVNFLRRYFLETETTSFTRISSPLENDHGYLSEINVFPIKSCAAFQVTGSWPLTESGLIGDRILGLITAKTGKMLTQKLYPRMSLIRPKIQMRHDTIQSIVISAPEMPCLVLDFENEPKFNSVTETKVCGKKASVTPWSNPVVHDWFSKFLDTDVVLVLQTDDGLFNESHFMVCSESSLSRLQGVSPIPLDIASFRPNFVISGLPAFIEDTVSAFCFGDFIFQVVKPCRRCHMVCVDQQTAVVGREPYLTLARCRKFEGGQLRFGSHLKLLETSHGKNLVLTKGMDVCIHSLKSEE